jgi:hypothetical protein
VDVEYVVRYKNEEERRVETSGGTPASPAVLNTCFLPTTDRISRTFWAIGPRHLCHSYNAMRCIFRIE